MFPFLVIFCLHIDVLTFVPFIYNKTRMVTRCKIVVPPSSKFRMKRVKSGKERAEKKVEKLCLFFSYLDNHLITILCSD